MGTSDESQREKSSHKHSNENIGKLELQKHSFYLFIFSAFFLMLLSKFAFFSDKAREVWKGKKNSKVRSIFLARHSWKLRVNNSSRDEVYQQKLYY